LIFEPCSGSGSPIVDVLLSGITLREASGAIASAVLEMGSRALTSLTEAKPRVKSAGRTAMTEVLVNAQLRPWKIVEVSYRSASQPGERMRVCKPWLFVCGVESAGCLGDQRSRCCVHRSLVPRSSGEPITRP
jgi:hypothetical protein